MASRPPTSSGFRSIVQHLGQLQKFLVCKSCRCSVLSPKIRWITGEIVGIIHRPLARIIGKGNAARENFLKAKRARKE